MRLRVMFSWATPAFVAVVLALVLAECLLRVGMADFFSGRFQYGYDESSGFIEEPDGQIRFVRAGGRRFYPQSMRREKPAGTLRIITVGDSIARGASLAQAYPAELGRQLAGRGHRVESINLSVPGFGSARQGLVLQRALRYQPDLVILHFGMSNEFEDERDEKRARQAASNHPRNWPMKSVLIARLHEYKTEQATPRLLPEPIRLIGALDDALEEVTANRDPARVQAWRERFAGHFSASLDALARARVPVLLVPRVVLQGEAPDTALDDSGLAAMLASRLGKDVQWLDLQQVFGEHPATELFSRDRIHWSPAAHRRMGEALAPVLEAWLRTRGAL